MSRSERREQEVKPNRPVKDNGISKVYYIVIGILFLILIGLIIFIFARGSNVNIDNNESDDPVEDVQPEIPEEPNGTENSNNESETEEPTEPSEDEDDAVDSGENTEEEPENGDNQNTEDGGSTAVNPDAAHDPSHAVDYNSGSADRVAIKEQIMAATGLSNDLTEWWIGNNGPGRVKATVSDSSNSVYYDVYLQYGDGNWHVTSYEEVSGN